MLDKIKMFYSSLGIVGMILFWTTLPFIHVYWVIDNWSTLNYKIFWVFTIITPALNHLFGLIDIFKMVF